MAEAEAGVYIVSCSTMAEHKRGTIGFACFRGHLGSRLGRVSGREGYQEEAGAVNQ